MARKRIGFMINFLCVAKNLNLQCPNTTTKRVHDHVVLINGRAKKAEIYPPSLCRAVCKGLIEQLRADKLGQFMIAELDIKREMAQAGRKRPKRHTNDVELSRRTTTRRWKQLGTTYQGQNWGRTGPSGSQTSTNGGNRIC